MSVKSEVILGARPRDVCDPYSRKRGEDDLCCAWVCWIVVCAELLDVDMCAELIWWSIGTWGSDIYRQMLFATLRQYRKARSVCSY
ncbi:hypothetical protein J6590_052463 [Homalodisca vitripennis]|nr:hypothetical protein J6590_052463 [Homalodisca vitripennis]